MRIQLTCHKGPVKSILKTSTAYPSLYVDHQHHFSQQNPRSTAKENGEKSALAQLLEEQAREFEENRTRRLQEDEADHTRRLEETTEYWAKRTEDRVQQEQRADKRYKREMKARNERFELFLKQVTGSPPLTTVCTTNANDTIIDDNFLATIDTIEEKSCTTTTTTGAEEFCYTIDATFANKFTTRNTTTEEESIPTITAEDRPDLPGVSDSDQDNFPKLRSTSKTNPPPKTIHELLPTENQVPTMIKEEPPPPPDNIRINNDDDIPPTTIEEAEQQQQQTRHT